MPSMKWTKAFSTEIGFPANVKRPYNDRGSPRLCRTQLNKRCDPLAARQTKFRAVTPVWMGWPRLEYLYIMVEKKLGFEHAGQSLTKDCGRLGSAGTD